MLCQSHYFQIVYTLEPYFARLAIKTIINIEGVWCCIRICAISLKKYGIEEETFLPTPPPLTSVQPLYLADHSLNQINSLDPSLPIPYSP